MSAAILRASALAVLLAAVGAEQEKASAEEAASREPGESRVFDGIEFVWIPAGEFRMGSTSPEAYDFEQPVTRVRIRRGYWLGKYAVTQDQWQGVMGTNPSEFSDCGSCPVESVSWNYAQEFIRRLNGRAGGNRYRLPTEAEWEYAARAGTTDDRYGELDEIAWYKDNSGDRTHPVGQKAPNAWGLYDMLGNVWEWVEDRFGDYRGGSVKDPRGPRKGPTRVVRGGSWFSDTRSCRASMRTNRRPSRRFISPFRPRYEGFRLLRME